MMPGASSSRNSGTMMMPDDLPAGFRFHPTDEELIVHYLMNQAAAVPCPVPIIAEVNIYRSNPWDLPAKAALMLGDNNNNEWYFFSPRDRKYPNGARPNRAAGSGYWKATGTDKPILSSPSLSAASDESVAVVGVKKALVFYSGRPPKGVKTDWIMHEYRLTPTTAKRRGSSISMRLDDWVLCRIYKKSNDFFSQQFMSDHDHHHEAASRSSTVDQDSSSSSLTTTNMAGGGGGGSVGRNPNKPETLEQADRQSRQAADDQTPAATAAISKSCSLTDLLNTMDFSALSQMLLLDAPDAADADDPPLIYYPTTHNTQDQELDNYNTNNNIVDNTNNNLPPRVDSCSDSDLKRKRTTTATTVAMDNNAAAGSYSFDDGTTNNNAFSKRLMMQLPGDSRSSHLVGGSSSSTGSYCNPLLVDTNGFQQFQPGSGLMMTSYPFLEMQL